MLLILLQTGCLPATQTGQATIPAAFDPSPPAPTRAVEASLAALPALPALTPTLPPPTPVPPTPTPAYNPFDEELPAGEVAYVLPLTVRHLTETQAVLFFELDQPAVGYLIYQALAGEAQTNPQVVPLAAGQARQQILLENLTPYTEYRALVGLGSQPEAGELTQPAFSGGNWGSLRFRTLSDEQLLKIGVIGDASFGDAATAALVARMAGYDLDFVIHTGDVVANIENDPGPAEAYATKYYQTLSPLLHRLPVYTVIGNHDYDLPARWLESVYYYHAFPPIPDLNGIGASAPPATSQYYAFAAHGIQFMLLDSQVLYGVQGRDAEEAWMEERLADPRFRWTIPVLHVPPYYSGSVHETDQLVVRSSWAPRFSASGKVPLAFSGHSHHYERIQADGITYIVSGGGSSILYAQGELQPESQVFARRTHFVLLEISSQNIDLTAIDIDGVTIDQAVIPLP